MATSVVAALACALIALAALPALAPAATFEVDSNGDGPDATAGSGACETASGECTLRAAIEAANANLGFDFIHFDPAKFDGSTGSGTITIGSPLPPITEPAEIDAGRCLTEYGTDGPCAGVTGLAAGGGQDVIRVEANATTIQNLAIGGGENGIVVAHQATGFTAAGNWLGFELDGGEDGSAHSGILLGPGSAGATIGGDKELDRNVFGFSDIGVNVDGAADASIRGNYIGVRPDGVSLAALPVGVMIADAEGSPGWQAEGAEVGGILTAAEAASPVCDGPCNVIVTEAGPAIDLAGEGTAAATGPTTIRGNYIGLASDGVTTLGDSQFGVLAAPAGGCVQGPGDVTVGGTAPTETNYIEGGLYGIYAEGAENFRALGNAIGIAADGSAGESPLAAGIEDCAEGVTEPAQISNNKMLLGPNPIGIVSEWGRAEITGNTIQGSQIGVLTAAESEGHGDLIQGNTVSDPDRYGIAVASQSNVLIGNSISNSGEAGIELEEADHNRIGGDLPGEENSIDGSVQGAIVIAGEESTRNEVAANNGFGNGGGFLQLIGQSPSEAPNGGIQPPTLATTLQSSAAGTAQPNATVRIFSKASAEPGELESLLAVVKADSAGSWKATYATVPVGTLVAATQTSGAGTPEGATSEVSEPTAAGADPVVPSGGDGGGGTGGGSSQSGSTNPTPTPKPAPPTRPRVKFTKRPAKSSKWTTATFRFTAIPAAGARFQCRLNKTKWAGCKSPRTYKRLKPRKYTFQVRAVAAGLTGPAARYGFTVKA